ncbi:MAG: hypothetical protein LJF04_06900 [Gemmatimonadetes bacterium]|nr:hypothetical protein [Gemmatimonadota bacterium]
MLLTLVLVGFSAVVPARDIRGDTVASAPLRLCPTASQVTLFTPLPARPRLIGLVDLPMTGVTPSEAEEQAGSTPQLVEYSDAYFTRLTIHKWASWLTLPLFAGQYVVGQKLINGEGSDRLRGVHGVLAGGIAGLFVVNTVTGGLNAIEARKDPEGKNRRTLHTVLMLLADAGFVITGATAQERENEGGRASTANNTTHRNVALASMGTALVGVAIMLPIFGR